MTLRVLICNDDGPPNKEESPFILPFVEHLEQLGWQVQVCLPDTQKSWISKSFMIKDKIELSYYHRKTHEISYHRQDASDFTLLSGTPATCINIALYHLFKDDHFDLVICGPNYGRNSSSIYTLASGTIGSALEATLCKKKAIALSFPFYSRDFKASEIKNACEMATQVIQQLYEKDNWPAGGLFNINVPLVDQPCPVHVTKFHQASYGSLFRPLVTAPSSSSSSSSSSPSPSLVNVNNDDAEEQQVRLASESGGDAGRKVFKFAPDIKAMSNPKDALPGTDAWSLQHKCISVTPMIAAYELGQLDVDYGVGILNKL